jgi:hypothetical protein
MRMWSALTVPSDTNGYHSIIGKALTKFKTLQRDGCINAIINVQIWHWAALPRNSDWPWLFNESYFWARLKMGGLPGQLDKNHLNRSLRFVIL